MTKKNAFAVVVDESWYQEYLPFYVMFINMAYPESHVFAFIRGKLNDNVKKRMDNIKATNCHIVTNYRMDLPQTPVVTKAIRWLITKNDVPNVDYLYIGDVDIFITQECVSLFDQHKAHMNFLGVPFSNIIRPGNPRLSGLHCVKVDEYYSRVTEAQKSMCQKLKDPNLKPSMNEYLLYDMIQESGLLTKKMFWVGYGKLPWLRSQFRPFHGVHMGVFRSHSGYTYLDEHDINHFLDVYQLFQIEPELKELVQQSDPKIQRVIHKMLTYTETMLRRGND